MSPPYVRHTASSWTPDIVYIFNKSIPHVCSVALNVQRPDCLHSLVSNNPADSDLGTCMHLLVGRRGMVLAF